MLCRTVTISAQNPFKGHQVIIWPQQDLLLLVASDGMVCNCLRARTKEHASWGLRDRQRDFATIMK